MRIFLVLFGLLPTLTVAAEGDVYCFDNEAQWGVIVDTLELLETDANGVALANEVAAPPGDNTLLGKDLTFEAINTGLSRSFLVQALEPSTADTAGFTFNDGEPNLNPSFENALSVGDINNFENDDWRLTVLSGAPINAFAFILRDIDESSPSERLELFDADGQLLGTCGDIPEVEATFIGFITSADVVSMVFDEDPEGDDIAIADFYFGTVLADGDEDSIPYFDDNCWLVSNPDQRDTNGDGIGNACDADVAPSGANDCVVNFLDLNVMKQNFLAVGDLDTDFNGDGFTNFIDLQIMKNYFLGTPGPSGVANACN